MHDEQIKEIKADNRAEKARLDAHLQIYANNGKELEAVKTNQAWLMRFFWILMTPTLGGIAYIVSNLPS